TGVERRATRKSVGRPDSRSFSRRGNGTQSPRSGRGESWRHRPHTRSHRRASGKLLAIAARRRVTLAQSFLWPLSILYGACARLRSWAYRAGIFRQRHLRGIVISVGNLTVGGTGKTPMVVWLVQRFAGTGKRIAVLSRGYRPLPQSSRVAAGIAIPPGWNDEAV